MKNNQYLNFSSNWNGGKVYCDTFTTIRLANPRKYAAGEKLEVYLKGKHLGTALVIEYQEFDIYRLPTITAFLDTGYDKMATIRLLKTMYKRVKNIDKQKFCIVLMKYTHKNFKVEITNK